jgi:hypothetical protein
MIKETIILTLLLIMQTTAALEYKTVNYESIKP